MGKLKKLGFYQTGRLVEEMMVRVALPLEVRQVLDRVLDHTAETVDPVHPYRPIAMAMTRIFVYQVTSCKIPCIQYAPSFNEKIVKIEGRINLT